MSVKWTIFIIPWRGYFITSIFAQLVLIEILLEQKNDKFLMDTVERLDQNVNNTVYCIGDYDAVSR